MQGEIVGNLSGLLTSHDLVELILGFSKIIGDDRDRLSHTLKLIHDTILTGVGDIQSVNTGGIEQTLGSSLTGGLVNTAMLHKVSLDKLFLRITPST